MAKKTKDDQFHDHLDVCRQCETQPFNLCAVGKRFLFEAAVEIQVRKIYKILERKHGAKQQN